jgi:hypothetical protein
LSPVNDSGSVTVLTTQSSDSAATTETTMPDVDDTVVTDVSFRSEQIRTDENATVVVTVKNPQETADTHEVELEMFGQVVNSQEVTVPAEGQRKVEFVHNIVAPGTYTARVDGETDTVDVVGSSETTTASPTTTSTTFPGFGVVAVLLAVVLGSVLLARRH